MSKREGGREERERHREEEGRGDKRREQGWYVCRLQCIEHNLLSVAVHAVVPSSTASLSPMCVPVPYATHNTHSSYLVDPGDGEQQKTKQHPIVLEVDVCPAV